MTLREFTSALRASSSSLDSDSYEDDSSLLVFSMVSKGVVSLSSASASSPPSLSLLHKWRGSERIEDVLVVRYPNDLRRRIAQLCFHASFPLDRQDPRGESSTEGMKAMAVLLGLAPSGLISRATSMQHQGSHSSRSSSAVPSRDAFFGSAAASVGGRKRPRTHSRRQTCRVCLQPRVCS